VVLAPVVIFAADGLVYVDLKVVPMVWRRLVAAFLTFYRHGIYLMWLSTMAVSSSLANHLVPTGP
jgi:hypothetical protein